MIIILDIMSEILFKQVKKFINKRYEFGVIIHLDTSLQDDLNIYGNEASDFLIEFCKKFNVKHKGFNFDNYFRPEYSWTDFFFKKKKYKKFIVQDLVNAVERGSL